MIFFVQERNAAIQLFCLLHMIFDLHVKVIVFRKRLMNILYFEVCL